MNYTVKSIKNFQGREGTGYSCSLYLDGKKIGTVTDTAGGGETDFYLDNGEKEKLDAYCKTLPVKKFSENMTIPTDCDWFVSDLVDEYEKQKKYRKWCKKETVFRIDGDKKGSYRVINKPYSDDIKKALEKNYAGKGLVIVNELIKK